MRFDMRTLPAPMRYRILVSTVTPRPIAWVTTMSPKGQLNAAPFSFFNAMGSDPAILVVSFSRNINGAIKHTPANILATDEFVVNLVSEHDAERMVFTSIEAPEDVNELELAGIATVPSADVKPPRIASAPVSFECRKLTTLDYPGQTLIVGEVIIAHVKDEFISDAAKLHFDAPAMKLIGRTYGSGWYTRTQDQFAIERPVYNDNMARAAKAD